MQKMYQPPRSTAATRDSPRQIWHSRKRVATVPLEGNAYAVDPALVSRRVELRYDPTDLTRIDVFYDGRPAGVATPFVTKRHTHRAVPQAKPPDPEPTGIDYLALVQKAHEEEAGTGGGIDFSQLMFAAAVTEQPQAEES
jgi:hypothetical protein